MLVPARKDGKDCYRENVTVPSKHALNVSLTDELCDFVAHQVHSGRFRTASEVVRAALRLLERETAFYPAEQPSYRRKSNRKPDDGSSAAPREMKS